MMVLKATFLSIFLIVFQNQNQKNNKNRPIGPPHKWAAHVEGVQFIDPKIVVICQERNNITINK